MRVLVAGLMFVGSAALAQGSFTTAAEVRPIMDMTKTSWIAVREWDGNDLVYFTHIESWRCGMEKVRYGINTAIADQEYELEICHEDMATPNAMTLEDHLPYIVRPLGSVETVTIKITYDDGSVDGATFDRNGVMIP